MRKQRTFPGTRPPIDQNDRSSNAVIDQLHPEGTSFDVALRAADGRYMDSPLLHMAPKVAKAWSAKGFTPARAIVSKTARDAAPCNATYNATDATDWVRAN